MAVSLSIKNVPESIVERLRARALKHHRSMQGELLAILEEGVRREEAMTPSELLKRVKTMGVKTSAESAKFVREDRDGGHSR